MCGIAGVIQRRDGVSNSVAEVLSAGIAFRGPDGHGSWRDSDERVFFKHYRLSILDLSEGGRQPMTTPDGRYVMVFNGEIYNFRELRERMIQDGEVFTTTSDTEVLLRFWQRGGASSLNELRGMFAFAVWDTREETLFLARDPLGMKPLYFSLDSAGIRFSSLARPLAATGSSALPDPVALENFLQHGSIPPPRTFWQEVRSVQAGEYVIYRRREHTLSKQIYWSPLAALRSASVDPIRNRDEAVSWIRETLTDSLRAHFVSDVPVGAFLSGGIDSSAIISLARRSGVSDLRTFCLSMSGSLLDEADFARETAASFGTRHEVRQIAPGELGRALPAYLSAMDQPTVDGLNVFLVSQFAREAGMKVVLSGCGGDEWFGGYRSIFKTMPRTIKALSFLPMSGRLLSATALSALAALRGGDSRLSKAAALMKCKDLKSAYPFFRALYLPEETRGLLLDSGTSANLRADWPESLAPADDGICDFHQLLLWEGSAYLGSQLLADSDNFSMRHGLELRLPFVDRVVFERLLRVDPALHRAERQTKGLLVAAVGDLPSRITQRRKGTFTLPFRDWLVRDGISGDSGLLSTSGGSGWEKVFQEGRVREIEAGIRRGRIHWSRGWLLVVLWYRMTHP